MEDLGLGFLGSGTGVHLESEPFEVIQSQVCGSGGVFLGGENEGAIVYVQRKPVGECCFFC